MQLGGALGLAVLVSVFGAGFHAAGPAMSQAAKVAFVAATDHAFVAAALLVGLSVALLGLVVPGRRPTAPVLQPVELPEWVRTLQVAEEQLALAGEERMGDL